MTDEERQALGITKEQELELSDWIIRRVGGVLGADGRGGSGTFIRLRDGRNALMTARHVVVRCILTGELSVGRMAHPGRSVEPRAIRIDNKKDAAFLLLDEGSLPGESVAFDELMPGEPQLAKGMPAIVSGIVGEWRFPDPATRTIPLTKVLNLWTTVIDPVGQERFVVCHVDETLKELPKSFGGMSGGPFLSIDRRIGLQMGRWGY